MFHLYAGLNGVNLYHYLIQKYRFQPMQQTAQEEQKKIIHSPFFVFFSQVIQTKWCGITEEQAEALQWVRSFKHSSKSPSTSEAGLNTWIYFKAISLQVSQILSSLFKLCFGFRKHILLICLYQSPATDRFQEFGALHHLFLLPLKPVVSSFLHQ